jgi:gliding motility-associated protein GldM
MIGFLNKECSDMIELAEKVPWYDTKEDVDEFGNVFRLRSLRDVQNMDNYDIPTNIFIGSNPQQPVERGLAIPAKIHEYRNKVTELMGNYDASGKKFTFKAPDDPSKLKDALKTANPEDTTMLAKVYNSLTIPPTIKVKHAGQEAEMPWASVMFDHAPIVAAAAMFTALTVDIKQVEGDVVGFMLSKVDAPSFNFNKIEPMAFAPTGYLNTGDTMSLRVMIAAYDSTETPKIVWNGTEFNGPIPIKAASPGAQKMEGVIYVKERGQEVPKPWSFNYTVGKPSGAISLPEMNVLYRGYPNKVTGAASGYPDYKLIGASNVTLTRSGQEYIATPGAGTSASISLQGVSADGRSANLGSFNFRVRPLPPAQVYFGAATNGGKGSKNETNLAARYDNSVTLDVKFSVVSWEMEFMGRSVEGQGSTLTSAATSLLKQSKPNQNVTFMVKYKGPDGIIRPGVVAVKL